MGGKRNSSGAAVQSASAEDARLVDPKAEARWKDLDDEGLNAEIKEYRCVFFFFEKFALNPSPRSPYRPAVLCGGVWKGGKGLPFMRTVM